MRFTLLVLVFFLYGCAGLQERMAADGAKDCYAKGGKVTSLFLLVPSLGCSE